MPKMLPSDQHDAPVRGRVFFSFTSDLTAYVDAATEAARAAGWQPVRLDATTAGPEPPLAASLQLIAECDALIVILAFRYGFVPSVHAGGDGEHSFTWLEVQEAERLGRPVLPFFIRDDALVQAKSIDADPATQARLSDFKSSLLRDRIVGFFSSPSELATQVQRALPRIPLPGRTLDHTDRPARTARTGTPAPETYEEALTTSDEELLAMAWRLVADRRAEPDMLLHLDATRWRAAIGMLADEVLPAETTWNAGLPLLLDHLAGRQPGLEPNPLWTAWVRHVHSAKLAALRAMPSRPPTAHDETRQFDETQSESAEVRPKDSAALSPERQNRGSEAPPPPSLRTSPRAPRAPSSFRSSR